MRALDFGRHVGTPTTPNTNAPVLIKQVFDILVSLWFSHKMLCRSQILALGIYFWLFYAEHRKYYSKISWKKVVKVMIITVMPVSISVVCLYRHARVNRLRVLSLTCKIIILITNAASVSEDWFCLNPVDRITKANQTFFAKKRSFSFNIMKKNFF